MPLHRHHDDGQEIGGKRNGRLLLVSPTALYAAEEYFKDLPKDKN